VIRRAVPAVSVFLSALTAQAMAAAEVYTVEPVHTYPSFRAAHQGISFWMGKFNKTSGKIWLDREHSTGRM
jgi:polyisoprenoid-binding protein YceI